MPEIIKILHEADNCTTRMSHQRVSMTWKISNFIMVTQNEKEYLKSTPFSSANMEWVLLLYPNNKASRQYISLYLKLERSSSPIIMARDKFGIINKDNKKINVFERITEIGFFEGETSGCKSFLKKALLLAKDNPYIFDDGLTIFCDIDVYTKQNVIFPTLGYKIPECRMKEQLVQLFKNQQCTDITFILENEKISAHKVILGASSPVFAAMFQNDMIERYRKEITIKEINFEAFKEMIGFIYSGECPNISILSKELLKVSEIYHIDTLKSMIEDHLSDEIDLENVVEILIMADHYSAFYLKKCAMDFVISIDLKEIVKTEDWICLMRKQIHLVTEIIDRINA